MIRHPLIGGLLLALVFTPLGAFAFPGGKTFTGKLKCTTTYNNGTAGPFSRTDIVTLAFSAVSTAANKQTGTVQLTHTETNAAGIYLDDQNPLDYVALVNPAEKYAGLLSIYLPNPGSLRVGSVGEFKAKPDGSIKSLRFVSAYAFGLAGQVQRCSGTLKLAP